MPQIKFFVPSIERMTHQHKSLKVSVVETETPIKSYQKRKINIWCFHRSVIQLQFKLNFGPTFKLNFSLSLFLV